MHLIIDSVFCPTYDGLGPLVWFLFAVGESSGRCAGRHQAEESKHPPGSVTVDELAKDIGLAPATIRRHLDILQRDQLAAFEQV